METKPGGSTPENRRMDYRVRQDPNTIWRRGDKPAPAICEVVDLQAPAWEARLACILVERWGLFARVPDGENPDGTRRYRALAPAELVAEACATAELACAEFRKRGWVLELPTLAEADAMLAEQFERDKVTASVSIKVSSAPENA